MNDNDRVLDVLRDLANHGQPLDPTTVIAGARRRRTRNKVVTGVATLAAAAVAVTGFALANLPDGAGQDAGVAGGNGTPAVAASLSPAGFLFVNRSESIGSLPDGKRIAIGEATWFETKGTKWAVTTQVPGQPEIQPDGWRATVGSSKLGNPINHPSLTSTGLVFVTVFKSDNASRVVYTIGDKAYFAKLNRLAGIPGWVAATLDLSKTPPAYDRPGKIQGTQAVFVYDRAGKILGQFPSGAKNPFS